MTTGRTAREDLVEPVIENGVYDQFNQEFLRFTPTVPATGTRNVLELRNSAAGANAPPVLSAAGPDNVLGVRLLAKASGTHVLEYNHGAIGDLLQLVNAAANAGGIGLRISGIAGNNNLFRQEAAFLDASGNAYFATSVGKATVGLTEVLRLTYQNNVGINTTNQFGGAQGVVGLANRTVLPSSNPTGGLVLYAEGGQLRILRSSGTIDAVSQLHEHTSTSNGGVLTTPKIAGGIEPNTSADFLLYNAGGSAANLTVSDLGTLTINRLNLVFGGTSKGIVAGPTSFILSSNGGTANITVLDAGGVTFNRGGLTVTTGISNFNSNLLYVDSVNSRVGFGATAPGTGSPKFFVTTAASTSIVDAFCLENPQTSYNIGQGVRILLVSNGSYLGRIDTVFNDTSGNATMKFQAGNSAGSVSDPFWITNLGVDFRQVLGGTPAGAINGSITVYVNGIARKLATYA